METPPPDNYMQDPTTQQGFNRYAYCMYNPLKYVDPSGEQYFGWDPGLAYRMEQEARGIVLKLWNQTYDMSMASHSLTIAMANSLFSHGQQNAGNGSGNHGSSGGGIQVSDMGGGKYKVVGGSVGANHSITVIDGENAGTIIGYYLTDYSFTLEDGNIAIGAIIDLNDYSGQKFWDKYTNNPPYLEDYIADIYLGDKTNMLIFGNYNFKYLGYTDGDKDIYAYRGMPIYFGDGNTYITTARDIGNVYAGFLFGYYGWSYESTRNGFDWFNGGPEPPVSKQAQDYGYKLGIIIITGKNILNN